MNSNLYEINTRVWLNNFNKEEKRATLKDVPVQYWEELANKGFDYVWLMGIWKTNKSVIKKYCFEEGLVNSYSKALKDWKDEDVIGSPYSISQYKINPAIGTEEELLILKRLLNNLGIKLILDFVPNHFSVHSSLIISDPYLFIEADEKNFNENTHLYFKSDIAPNKIFAHGRDPFFPAWQDTIQVNYFNEKARRFMINILKDLTTMCDGVRCDMAMLNLNNVFNNTWGAILNSKGYKKPEKEFWELAIKETKEIKPDFLFIGEAYWDLGWQLQQLGFDYTYDKTLLDRLKSGYVEEIRGHLTAEDDYQSKLVRFLENHDEERAVKSLGIEKSKAAAVIFCTIKGMHLFYDGQLVGKKTKLPVQLGRDRKEKPNECISKFYTNLLEITKTDIFKKGDWKLLNSDPAWEGNFSYHNILIWRLTYLGRKRLVVVNYSDVVSQCRVKLQLDGYPGKFKLKDILNDKKYYRKTNSVVTNGLFIELGPFKSHIFSY